MPRIFRHYVSYSLLGLIAVEGGIVLSSVYTAVELAHLTVNPILAGPGPVLPKAIVLALLVLTMCHLFELYDLRHVYGRRELGLRLFLAFAGAYFLMAAFGYLAAILRLGRATYGVSFLLSFSAAFLTRLTYRRVLNASRIRRRLLLLGSGRPAQLIAETVNGSNPTYEMIGCVDGHPERIGQQLNGVNIIGTVQDLGQVSRATRPDVIVVALMERRQSLPLPAILECKLQGIEVEDWPSFYEKLTGKILLTDLRPSWLIFSDGFKKTNVVLALKRGMDLVLAALGLLMTLPLFPLIAFLIKLDSRGAVFYRQERMGHRGQPFELIKFRSMRLDAEQTTGPVWAGERDTRVTRVGRLLRRSRVDELPQLINVLRGEMSLVGPRPERPAFVQQLQEKVPFYIHRLAVKPGITGWAQVKYRYGSTVEDALEKLQYDLYYIKNLSIFLDLLIIVHTLQVVLTAKGSR